MRTEQYGRHKITFYESIDEMPIDRFTAWNRYMMIDSSLGNTFEDIDRIHLSQLASIIDDKPKAMQAIQNMRELIYSIINKLNYNHHAFCCMIHSIDKELITDYSDNGIKETIKLLDKIGVSNGDIKKKTKQSNNQLIQVLKRFFLTSSAAPKNITITQS